MTAAAKPTIDVLMVSTSYPANLGDWRGLFMRHLAEALARREDLRLQLWSPPGEMPANVTYAANASESHNLSVLMAAGGIAHLMRQHGVPALLAPLRLLAMLRHAYRRQSNVSLYHVNWLQNALPLPCTDRPLLVTVLGTDLQLLKLPLMRWLLRRTFRGRQVAICPNADWMLPTLESAFGDLARVQFVPFGIDPDWFRIERSRATDEPRRWLCVSRLTMAKLGPLFAWGEPFFSSNGRELHLFGPMQEQIELPDWVHYHGPATPEALCRDWFPHAQGLITLSEHAEGRPQVMLEAMAASLPIIASNLPAHSSFVRHRETGWLCSAGDQLGPALSALEDDATNQRIGQAARDWASHAVGSWDDCAERYVRIYRGLLESNAQ